MQARYRMELNPRETARFNADKAYAADRQKCAVDYAAQVEAPVDLYASGGKEPVFSTDAEAP